MKKDIYLKLVVTVIAIALVAIALKPLFVGSATEAMAESRITVKELNKKVTPYSVTLVQKIEAVGLKTIFPLGDQKTFILQLSDSAEVYQVQKNVEN